MNIPILWQHDPGRSVGSIEGNVITLEPKTVTVDELLECGFGIVVTECEYVGEVRYALRAEIKCLGVGFPPK